MSDRNVCWACGSDSLIWDSSESLAAVYGDDEKKGVVSFLHCANCNAHVEYTQGEEG